MPKAGGEVTSFVNLDSLSVDLAEASPASRWRACRVAGVNSLGASAASPVQRRPRDRRDQVEAAAARAFAAHGYHGVSMQDVADAVGISAPALYRHFPHKYALFSETALALVRRVVTAVDGVDALPPSEPEDAARRIDDLLDVIIRVMLDMRSTGRIYRWEARYLGAEDRAVLAGALRLLRDRLAVPLRVLRPELTRHDAGIAAWSALSVAGSVTMHRTAMPIRAQRALLHDAARRAVGAPIVAVATSSPETAAEDKPSRSRRDQIIRSSIRLFAERGYYDVTIEDIGQAVRLTPSGVYRYFTGKSAILRAACERAAAVTDAVTDAAPSGASALGAVIDGYIAFAVRDRDLMEVYTADSAGLDPADRRWLTNLQRTRIGEWVGMLREVRPDLDQPAAMFLMQAAINLIADLSSVLRREEPSAVEQRIRPLVESVLGVAS